jgi:ABC-type transport system involved in multi-copper enzyme maturation permease subunit
MTDALSYEWVRLRTLRSTWWLSGVAAVLGCGVALLIGLAFRSEITGNGGPTGEDLRLLPGVLASDGASVFVPYLIAFVVAMIGIFAWGHEYRHGMVRATLTAVPDRVAVWAAKFLVVGVWVAALTAVVSTLSLLIGALTLSGVGVDVLTADAWRMVGRCTVYTLLLTWVVTAFTAIVRQQVVALVLMFLWPFVIENVITGIVLGVPALRGLSGAVRFLPFDAGQRMVRDLDIGLAADPFSPWQGFAVLATLCVLLLAASLVLFRRRDA